MARNVVFGVVKGNEFVGLQSRNEMNDEDLSRLLQAYSFAVNRREHGNQLARYFLYSDTGEVEETFTGMYASYVRTDQPELTYQIWITDCEADKWDFVDNPVPKMWVIDNWYSLDFMPTNLAAEGHPLATTRFKR